MTTFKIICFLAISSSAFANALPNGTLVSNECEVDSDCNNEGLKCIEQKCQCLFGFILDGSLTKCLKVTTGYGNQCEDSRQCSEYLSAGGTCKDGLCVCSEGYHYFQGYCHKTKGLNEACKKDEDCFVHTEYEAASCQEGICACSEGFYQREYSTCRRKATKDGDDCVLDFDCISNKTSKCISNKCTLEEKKQNYMSFPKMIFSKTDDIGIGSSCEKHDECKTLNNLICGAENICICKRAHFFNGKICVPEIGNDCKPSEEPTLPTSVCKNGLWTCEADRVALKNNQLCRKIVTDIGATCQYKEVCQLFGPNADCVDGKCICKPGTHWLEAEYFCWISEELGNSCTIDQDCHQRGHSPKTICKAQPNEKDKKVCSCPEGSSPSTDGSYCISDVPALETYCEANDACGLDNSICKDNKCQCRETYFESEGACRRGLNATCKTNDECKVNNTVCFEETKTCQCDEKLVDNENECIPKSSYKKPCKYDVQCTSVLSNSHCKINNNITSEEVVENYIDNENGTCECLSDHFYNMGSCFKIKYLGEECTSVGECAVESAVCINGKCSCAFDYEQDGKRCIKENSAASTMGIQSSLLLLVTTLFCTLL